MTKRANQQNDNFEESGTYYGLVIDRNNNMKHMVGEFMTNDWIRKGYLINYLTPAGKHN
jgi:hypothetical protein